MGRRQSDTLRVLTRPLHRLGCALLATILFATPALALQNSASGSCSGSSLDLSAASVTLNLTGGTAVSSVTAEINPGGALINRSVAFDLTLQPQINPGNSGLNQVTVSIPAGYGGLTPTGVSVDGVAVPAGSCPSPAAGSQCSSVSGNTLTVLFGSRITTDGSRIAVTLSASTPAASGSAPFSVSVDETTLPPAAQAAVPGDADGDPANSNSLNVAVSAGIDPDRSTLVALPSVVIADGVASASLVLTLVDSAGLPVAGHSIDFSSDRGGLDLLPTPVVTDTAGRAVTSLRSLSPGNATISAFDSSDGTPINQRATVAFTQGEVLLLAKTADRRQLQVGDLVTYAIDISNLTSRDVVSVQLSDRLPPHFSYRAGSARLNGIVIADPPDASTLVFSLGTVAALVDSNGNGRADAGEPGYQHLTYQLIANAGATPGHYVNTAWATDVCRDCPISNQASASIKVVADPLFDQATIIGKVFTDADGNGRQDAGEEGVAGVMVALDDGTYILTDAYGRYHFPAVDPGERLLKINLQGLGNGVTSTTNTTQIAHLTPGLLAKINFGITTQLEQTAIGKEPEYGVAVESRSQLRPVEVIGSLHSDRLLLNGTPVSLPGGDVQLQFRDLDSVVRIEGGVLPVPVNFAIRWPTNNPPQSWQLTIFAAGDNIVRTFSGDGAPPPSLSWDGELDTGELIAGGAIYQYQMAFTTADGQSSLSPRRLFGVDRVSAIAMNLTGSAFPIGAAELSPEAREALDAATEILHRYPHEKIVIEGHSDATGRASDNLALSQRRAQAALDYLVHTGGLPAERFVARGYGEQRPLASNDLDEGRELNRRVEIKGEYQQVERAQLLDQYRSAPQVAINGTPVPTGEDGRFRQPGVEPQNGQVEIAVNDSRGARRATSIAIPGCRILEPAGATILPFGLTSADATQTANGPGTPLDTEGTMVRTWLRGEVTPGDTLLVDGRPLAIDSSGAFNAPLALHSGSNRISLLVRDPSGLTRLADLNIEVATETAGGALVLHSAAVPYLSVQMPPTEQPLDSEAFILSGQTASENQVVVNGQPVSVDGSGDFHTTLTLPQGQSVVRIVVTDPQGNSGVIERQLSVSDTRLFFLAFADGKISRNSISGNHDQAATEAGLVTEGRIALYLKGTIAGRYLLTAALDTGQNKLDKLFDNLDEANTDRLLTNLDPDKLYPVYGDDSTLVHDVESQGKLYLAIDSDELHLLVGNSRIVLQGGELAAYQRTLFGASARYRSLDTSTYGAANIQVELFGAEVRQIPVRDELSATGGSLYYLSRKGAIEGSEQVSLVVRDALTGLTLARLPQEPNVDYSINYDQGRLLFRQPVSSSRVDQRLIDKSPLAGNPVSIEVTYEATVDNFEKTAVGGHVRQQIGDHLALGATAVEDETGASPYRLLGIDSELRFGKGNRIVAEYAKSEGSGATVNQSTDGGLTWSATPTTTASNGQAWKTAAEFDIGEWFDRPGLLQTTFYYKQLDDAYDAAGQQSEAGTRKSGASLTWRPGAQDTVYARFDHQETTAALATSLDRLDAATLQWRHQQKNWRLISEYQMQSSRSVTGLRLQDEHLAALRLEIDATSRLTTWVEQQQTLAGEQNNQSSIGLDYRPLDNLSLHASATEASRGRSAEAGVGLHLEQSRLYLSQRLQDENATRSTATVVGGETTAGPLNSRLYSEYQWLRSNDEPASLALTGIEKIWETTSGWRLLLGGEYAVDDRAETTWRRTVTGGLAYSKKEKLRLSTRAELRRESGGSNLTQILSISQGKGKLSEDFSLLGLLRFSRTENRETGQEEAGFREASAGLAYRPIDNDLFNALFRVAHLEERSLEPLSGIVRRSLLDSVAFEWSLQLLPQLEWVKKDAVRWKEQPDAGDQSRSCAWLTLNRLNLQLVRTIDAGLEHRLLTEKASDSRNQGWLTEIGWRPKPQFRFAIGYNFTDFSDDERSFNNYSVYGWFLRAQGMY